MGSPAAQALSEFKGDHFSAKMAGCVPDGAVITDGHILSGTKILTSASAPWANSPSDPLAYPVGKFVCVLGAGAAGGPLYTTVASFTNSGTIVLAVNASTTVTGATVAWGTDNTANMGAFISTCLSIGRVAKIPAGIYIVTGVSGGTGIDIGVADGTTLIDIEGEGVTNISQSTILYCGSGVGLHVHSADHTAFAFAFNLRRLTVSTIGTATDAVLIEDISQGVIDNLAINPSNSYGTATNSLHLVNPNLLWFNQLIATDAGSSCVLIDSTGFPRDATSIWFTGCNLFQNPVVFDLRANLTHLIVRQSHVESFGTLLKLNNTLNQTQPLRVDNLDFYDNEVLGNLGAFPHGSLVMEIVQAASTQLHINSIQIRKCRFFFVNTQNNPIQFTTNELVTAPDVHLEIIDNTWSQVGSSLMKFVGALSDHVVIRAENNETVFGSPFALVDNTGVQPDLEIPAYGGDNLLDNVTVLRSSVDSNGIPKVAECQGSASQFGLRWFNDTLHVTVDPVALQSNAQIVLQNAGVDRELRLQVPTLASGLYTAYIFLKGALGALGVVGQMSVGNGGQPTTTMLVHDDTPTTGSTQLTISPGAGDGAANALLHVDVVGGGSVQVLGNGVIQLVNSSGIYVTTGDPNGVISAAAGSIALDTNGVVWSKVGGGASGWVPNNFFFLAGTGIRTNEAVGINADPSGSLKLAVGGDADITGTLQVDGLTATTPVKTDGSKKLISSKIDIGASADVKAFGISSGQVLEWNGSNVVGVTGLSSGSLTEITAGPTGATIQYKDWSGANQSITVITGFSIATHNVTNGIVTT